MNWKISALKCPSKRAAVCSILPVALLSGALLVGCSGGSSSGGGTNAPASFRAAASFDVKPSGGEVAEIAAVTPNGQTLLYTDSETSRIGFVDISDLSNIRQTGFFAGEGSPTSVAITPNGRFAIAVFDGSRRMVVLNVADRSVARTINLPGQPDSVAISSDGRFAAIAIENQRPDEDLPLPNAPRGSLVVVNLAAEVADWTTRTVSLTLPNTLDFPTDPEPEYVSINSRNEAALTLQENNGIAIVNLASASVTRIFSAGRTTHAADLTDNGAIAFTDTLTNSRRQPDGIAWTPRGNLITANEGDYDLDLPDGGFVGGRNFTIFSPTGSVVFDDPGNTERAVIAAGRYADGRSDAKGVEPENVTVSTLGGRGFAFIALERADSLAVYRLDNESSPTLVQILPTGSRPEGVVVVPNRNLIVTANEGDGTLSFFTP
jgi:DNA-binding beta-propeller fold protein YncE